MNPPPRRHRLARSASALGAVALLAACGGGSTHRSGPTAAATSATSAPAPSVSGGNGEQLRRAAETMRTAQSFRFVADVSRSTGSPLHLVGEFSAPDHLHESITASAGAPVEVAFIGARAYRKRADGKWVESTAPPTTQPGSPERDPRAAFVVVANASSVTGSGATFHFALTGSEAHRLDGAAQKVEGTATVAGGAITALDYQGDDPGGTKVHISYADIGTTPVVIAPRLG